MSVIDPKPMVSLAGIVTPAASRTEVSDEVSCTWVSCIVLAGSPAASSTSMVTLAVVGVPASISPGSGNTSSCVGNPLGRLVVKVVEADSNPGATAVTVALPGVSVVLTSAMAYCSPAGIVTVGWTPTMGEEEDRYTLVSLGRMTGFPCESFTDTTSAGKEDVPLELVGRLGGRGERDRKSAELDGPAA